MKLKAAGVFLWGCLVATAALAGEEHKTKIVIETDDADGRFEWVSTDPNADFSDLEVGETRTITGEDGKEVNVTRTDEGLTFDIDGKKIQMAHFGDVDDVVVEVRHDHDIANGVTVISSSEIDDATRTKLREVLKESGAEGDVMFIDGSKLHGEEQAGVHIVKDKKVVEILVEEKKD